MHAVRSARLGVHTAVVFLDVECRESFLGKVWAFTHAMHICK